VVLDQGADSLGAQVELGNSDTCLPVPLGNDLLSLLFLCSIMLDKVLTKYRMYAVGRCLPQEWYYEYWWMHAPTFRMELRTHTSWTAQALPEEAMGCS
jgi:hypothetical protein